MRLFATTLAVLCSSTPTAWAQGDALWVLLPGASGADPAWLETAVQHTTTELDSQGVEVLPVERASKEFEAKVSSPATLLSEAELAQWKTLSEEAVRDLALAEDDAALQKLTEAQALSQRGIESLNREPKQARQVLDTCLYMVRAVLATSSTSRARDVARECRKLVPRGEPSPLMHPPAVTDLLQEVDALRAKQSGALQVRSVPSECTARLNGVLLGETPVEIGQLFPGRYRLQVECRPDQPGRVHVVDVGVGRAAMTVDSRFDSVVETRPRLALRYRTRAAERAHQIADAQRVARELDANRALVLWAPDDQTLELVLVNPDVRGQRGGPTLHSGGIRTRVLSFARLRVGSDGPTRTELASAVRTLIEGQCVDFTSGKPVALDCRNEKPLPRAQAPEPSEAAEGTPSRRRPHGQFVAGMTLAGLGISGLATGYFLLIPRATASEDWYGAVDGGGDGISAQERWLNYGKGSWASAAAGSAALITAMPLALPNRDKTPWWAWVSGAVGVGLGAFSIVYGVTADGEPSVSCSSQQSDAASVSRCVTRGEQISASVLTGLTAAPLLTMPLVYWFRPTKAKLEPQARIGRSGAYLGLRGKF